MLPSPVIFLALVASAGAQDTSIITLPGPPSFTASAPPTLSGLVGQFCQVRNLTVVSSLTSCINRLSDKVRSTCTQSHACTCEVYSRMNLTCLPGACRTELAASLIKSEGCEAATTTASGPASKTPFTTSGAPTGSDGGAGGASQTTSTSRAFADGLAIPAVGGILAGIVGALAVLL